MTKLLGTVFIFFAATISAQTTQTTHVGDLQDDGVVVTRDDDDDDDKK